MPPQEEKVESPRDGTDPRNNTLAVWGFLTAFFIPIIGAACGIALMSREDRRGGQVLVVAAIKFVVGFYLLTYQA